ncbi:MAG TPA: Crp/Fnr family transcriptional regulator [Methylocella sp.]|nr:Crp/Fnr family transcriptional regulator [Methylocella sp.]
MSTRHASPQAHNLLFSSLLPKDLALLVPHFKDVVVEQGVMLQEAGDPIELVYFPQSGMISLLAVMRAGNGIETATIGREGAVGALSGLGARIAVGRAVQQIAGVSSRIAVSRFSDAVNESPGIRDLIIRYSDIQMSLVHQSAGCNALHPVAARLCRWLLQTRDRSDSDRLALTQEFLSEMLGVHRTTVTVLARELHALGLIDYRRGRIEIINRSGLEKKACECYATVRRKTDEFYVRN